MIRRSTMKEKKRSIWANLRTYWGGEAETVTPAPLQRLRLSGRAIRVPVQAEPFAVEMGRQRLHLIPDLPLPTQHRTPPYDYLILDADHYAAGLYHFLRLRPGQKLDVDHRTEDLDLFSHPRELRRRHLQIRHDGEALVFKDPISELGTYIWQLSEETTPLAQRRQQALEHVANLYGGPLTPLSKAEALNTLMQVNEVLKQDLYRPKTISGTPGGLLELPAHLTPIIVGDLHGQVDNLLKILSENAFMESLERQEAVLLFLGDAVHGEAEDMLEDMESSTLMMDLIFKLKLRFPAQVFFLLGNHDSFSLDVMKRGVPQGLLWEKHLTAMRGEPYREAMALFYQLSPLVAWSEDFLACHAGAPRARITRSMLINIRRYPDLLIELTWNRIQKPGNPSGYTKADIRRFRKALGLAEPIPLIVGHYPLSEDQTVWLNVNNIAQHHIVFSAMEDQVGLFTKIDGTMVPQVYPHEPLIDWLNTQAT